MSRDVYSPPNGYYGGNMRPTARSEGEELRMLLMNPQAMQTIDQIIGQMLKGSPMPQYQMPPPYQMHDARMIPIKGAPEYSISMEDAMKLAGASQKRPVMGDVYKDPLVPMPNPGKPPPPRDPILGKQMLPPLPEGAPRYGPDGEILPPPGFRIGPDGEERINPDDVQTPTYYNFPEDPDAEDI